MENILFQIKDYCLLQNLKLIIVINKIDVFPEGYVQQNLLKHIIKSRVKE